MENNSNFVEREIDSQVRLASRRANFTRTIIDNECECGTSIPDKRLELGYTICISCARKRQSFHNPNRHRSRI